MGFQALLVEGRFCRDSEGQLGALKDDGTRQNLTGMFHPFEGQHIRLAFHHLPPQGIKPDLWGGGSCTWQSTGHCPAGHHEHPHLLLNVSVEGILRQRGNDQWAIEKLDRTETFLPLELLDGHYGRVAAATVLDVETMREQVLSQIPASSIEALGTQATDLRRVLEQIQRATKPK